ncbi:MAG: peptidase M4 [Acidocella sp. 20-57-95]|nr:MAG: peptidase M4 [Acidocella sp. 20-57-95]OYV57971.1 MAG: peptidase M4 [Acidocella sp. 21-58-7]HQU05385.1 PepSY domain-containing protein [Acidocella sp.]
MKFSQPVRALGAVAILAAFAGPALAYTGQELAGGAKISLEAAQATALQAQPGTVADQELEKESGGSGLRYSFDIKDSAGTHEVGIDAVTGALLENSAEGPHAD